VDTVQVFATLCYKTNVVAIMFAD